MQPIDGVLNKLLVLESLYQELTNADWHQLFQEDGEKAIEWLFKEHYSYLCRVVYKILPDANLVEDLVQEVFFELWRRKDRIHINLSIKAYLRRTAVNKTLNFIRDQKVKFDHEEKLPVLRSNSPTVNQTLEAQELQEFIDQSIDQLPERCRIIFILSRFEDMSYKEIAAKLGISIKTVENQISKALKVLRGTLGNY